MKKIDKKYISWGIVSIIVICVCTSFVYVLFNNHKVLSIAKKYDVKMNKSDISQYCSGKTEPNQEKLFVLSKALNVNEAWLMGFDVPVNSQESKNCS